ncbi:MAG TPA: aminoacyl-tRNA hydrolase [Methylomirabilota bacterium]|nr:aminoacyl-tRNA hydrolase [Methylomirabilota bacterium]
MPARAAQVVVGLGNPGPEYRHTRHNLGHRVVDVLGERLQARFRARGPATVAEVVWEDTPLFLAKPFAYMNVVGPMVARLLGILDLTPAALVVVHDDLDLPFGRVRVRHQGRSGGHNGVRSLIVALGTEAFRRVKIGVGRPDTRDEVVDWLVTTPFTRDEEAALPEIVERAADAALGLVATGAVRDPGPGPAGA